MNLFCCDVAFLVEPSTDKSMNTLEYGQGSKTRGGKKALYNVEIILFVETVESAVFQRK